MRSRLFSRNQVPFNEPSAAQHNRPLLADRDAGPASPLPAASAHTQQAPLRRRNMLGRGLTHLFGRGDARAAQDIQPLRTERQLREVRASTEHVPLSPINAPAHRVSPVYSDASMDPHSSAHLPTSREQGRSRFSRRPRGLPNFTGGRATPTASGAPSLHSHDAPYASPQADSDANSGSPPRRQSSRVIDTVLGAFRR
jgi:hypothetical protein